MKCKHNLIIGVWCVFIGAINLLIAIEGNAAVNPMNYAIGLICSSMGALNIGIWFGRNE